MSVIAVFNTSSQSFGIAVNGGSETTIAAADSTTSIPGSAALVFVDSAPPAPTGLFAYGANSCVIAPASGQAPATVTVTIPESVLAEASLQLYFFYSSGATLSWVLLAQGELVADSLSASS